MIEKIRILLGLNLSDASKDSVIKVLINLCVSDIKRYCNIDDISGMEDIIVQMVIFKYNRLGTEGLLSESYSGASYSYTEDYPTDIKRQLNLYRRLRVY